MSRVCWRSCRSAAPLLWAVVNSSAIRASRLVTFTILAVIATAASAAAANATILVNEPASCCSMASTITKSSLHCRVSFQAWLWAIANCLPICCFNPRGKVYKRQFATNKVTSLLRQWCCTLGTKSWTPIGMFMPWCPARGRESATAIGKRAPHRLARVTATTTTWSTRSSFVKRFASTRLLI